MLDNDIKTQLLQYLELLENDVMIKLSVGGEDQVSIDLRNFINEIVAISPKIKLEESTLARTPSFSINRVQDDSGIVLLVFL